MSSPDSPIRKQTKLDDDPMTTPKSKNRLHNSNRHVHFSDKDEGSLQKASKPVDPIDPPSDFENGSDDPENSERSLVGEDGRPAPCTPAITRLRSTLTAFHVQSPSDAIMSPCSKKLNKPAQRLSKFKHPPKLPTDENVQPKTSKRD
ncbi:hypothetical protein M3Y98_00394000 [Aphelenchoides besseyi]|nr:hypothetical protein M3Y98_00394000 [Aphelenchoides besseyi]